MHKNGFLDAKLAIDNAEKPCNHIKVKRILFTSGKW